MNTCRIGMLLLAGACTTACAGIKHRRQTTAHDSAQAQLEQQHTAYARTAAIHQSRHTDSLQYSLTLIAEGPYRIDAGQGISGTHGRIYLSAHRSRQELNTGTTATLGAGRTTRQQTTQTSHTRHTETAGKQPRSQPARWLLPGCIALLTIWGIYRVIRLVKTPYS